MTVSMCVLRHNNVANKHEYEEGLEVSAPAELYLEVVGSYGWLPCASISLHGWGGHTCVPPTVERDRRPVEWPINPPTTVLLSFTFILPRRNGVRSHSRCGTES